MIHCGDVLTDAKDVTELPQEFGCEMWVSVTYNFGRESELDKYVVDVEFGYSFGRDSLVAWYKHCHF